jgi:hypothetical protein
VLLRSKGVVVSDRGKVIREGWQVRIGKMSESKLADDASLRINILSKPGLTTGSGTSRDDTCLRTRRQSVYRRHEPNTGFDMERENLSPDAKGNDEWQTP